MFRRMLMGSGLPAGSLAFLLGACAAGGTLAPTPGVTATAAPGPLQSVTGAALVVTESIAYVAATGSLKGEDLDVYAPATAGAWPVVVMYHGSPPTNTKLNLSTQARSLAALGYVVFVPNWGHPSASGPARIPSHDGLKAGIAESTCAAAFAQAHAAEYGGDAHVTILFGHSAGANEASMIAFARPTPSAGCIGGPTLGAIRAVVTWDDDWMAIDPIWDAPLAADPRVMDVYTPWRYLAERTDLTVSILASEDPSPYRRDVGSAATATAFFAQRDPSGTLRAQLSASGALADGYFDLRELQEFFFSVLETHGYSATLTILPGATHDRLGSDGLKVLVAAFPKVLGD